jgi:hypothetical protein
MTSKKGMLSGGKSSVVETGVFTCNQSGGSAYLQCETCSLPTLQKCISYEGRDTQTHRQHGDLITHFYYKCNCVAWVTRLDTGF